MEDIANFELKKDLLLKMIKNKQADAVEEAQATGQAVVDIINQIKAAEKIEPGSSIKLFEGTKKKWKSHLLKKLKFINPGDRGILSRALGAWATTTHCERNKNYGRNEYIEVLGVVLEALEEEAALVAANQTNRAPAGLAGHSRPASEAQIVPPIKRLRTESRVNRATGSDSDADESAKASAKSSGPMGRLKDHTGFRSRVAKMPSKHPSPPPSPPPPPSPTPTYDPYDEELKMPAKASAKRSGLMGHPKSPPPSPPSPTPTYDPNAEKSKMPAKVPKQLSFPEETSQDAIKSLNETNYEFQTAAPIDDDGFNGWDGDSEMPTDAGNGTDSPAVDKKKDAPGTEQNPIDLLDESDQDDDESDNNDDKSDKDDDKSDQDDDKSDKDNDKSDKDDNESDQDDVESDQDDDESDDDDNESDDDDEDDEFTMYYPM
jgi:hypothetical protein